MGFSVRHSEMLSFEVAHELDDLLKFLKAFLLKEHNEDGTHVTDDPTSGVAPADAAYVTVGNTSSLSAERALVGTTNQITVTDGGAGGNVVLAAAQNIASTSSPEFTGLTVSGLTPSRLASTNGSKALTSVSNLASWVAGTANQVTVSDDGDGSITLATPQNIHTSASPQFTALLLNGAAGAATSAHKLVKKVTGIADNTATDILTVVIPNANHAAAIRVMLLSSNGSTDAFESSRTATGQIVVARTTGANAVAAAAALTSTAIATVAAGATHTLAYGVSAITGAVGASNSFTIQVTIDDSGNTGSNQVVVFAELQNSESTGITIS